MRKTLKVINFQCLHNFLRFLPECLNLAPVNKLPCKFSRIHNLDKTQKFTTFVHFIGSDGLSDQLLNNCQ